MWDSQESATRHQDVELSACCLRATWRSHFASFSRSLVFGSGVSKMSYRWQVTAAMLYAVQGMKQRPLGAPYGHRHHRREGARLVAAQSPTFGTRALPWQPPSPPAELASGLPFPKRRPRGYWVSGLMA
jgi:hypothetical protein